VTNAVKSLFAKTTTQNLIVLGLTVVVSVGFFMDKITGDVLMIQYANALVWLYPKAGNGSV
jgi:hypothetical protein